MNDNNLVERKNSRRGDLADNSKNESNRQVYVLAVLGLLYLLNPTAGFFELLPDNLPFIGNMDEGVAAVLVWEGFNQLRRARKSKKTDRTKNQ